MRRARPRPSHLAMRLAVVPAKPPLGTWLVRVRDPLHARRRGFFGCVGGRLGSAAAGLAAAMLPCRPKRFSGERPLGMARPARDRSHQPHRHGCRGATLSRSARQGGGRLCGGVVPPMSLPASFATSFGPVRQTVYVVNQPGAGSNTATGMVAASPADGYTLLVVSTGFVVNPSLFAKVPDDPVKDLHPHQHRRGVAQRRERTPSVPAKTMKELIEVIKANPGKYSFAAPGVGSTPICPARSSVSATISTCPPYSSPARLPPSNQPLAATRRWPSRRCRPPRRRSNRACCAASR